MAPETQDFNNCLFLYSNTTASFISRIRSYVREILANETNLCLSQTRVLSLDGSTYPLNIVVYENLTTLGFCDPTLYQIGLHKKLMFTAKTEVIKNILRHELAHYISVVIMQRYDSIGHSKSFKFICDHFSWGEEISAASVNLELANSSVEGDLPSERVIEKVKKLLALSSSSNKHEAELAMVMANKLILEHNLSTIRQQTEDNLETSYMKRVLIANKRSGKHHAISQILSKFWVKTIYNHGHNFFYMEVIGNKTNVEIANYVANFLDHELEAMWNDARISSRGRLSGITQKNSFMLGIAKGFLEKMERAEQESSNANKSQADELIILKDSLQIHLERVYERLRSSRSTAKFCPEANKHGRAAGEKLSIHAA